MVPRAQGLTQVVFSVLCLLHGNLHFVISKGLCGFHTTLVVLLLVSEKLCFRYPGVLSCFLTQFFFHLRSFIHLFPLDLLVSPHPYPAPVSKLHTDFTYFQLLQLSHRCIFMHEYYLVLLWLSLVSVS